jgi:hypothetical protein
MHARPDDDQPVVDSIAESVAGVLSSIVRDAKDNAEPDVTVAVRRDEHAVFVADDEIFVAFELDFEHRCIENCSESYAGQIIWRKDFGLHRVFLCLFTTACGNRLSFIYVWLTRLKVPQHEFEIQPVVFRH